MKAWPFLALIWLAAPAAAQTAPTATEALAQALPLICGGSPQGQLAQRCAELGPGAAFRPVAAAQRLEELPAHARAANRESPDARRPPENEGIERLSWDLWASASGGTLERREGRVEAGFESDRQGVLAGATWRLGRQGTIDGGWQWAREDLDYLASDGRVRTRLDGPFLMAAWAWNAAWSADLQIERSSGPLEVARSIRYTLPGGGAFASTASARTRTTRDGLALALRNTTTIGRWTLDSSLGTDRTRIRIDGFRESGGGGWDLRVPTRERRSRRVRADLAISTALSRPAGVWLPSVRLGRVHELQDPQRTLTLRFAEDANATPVRFLTDQPDRDWWEMALGLAWLRPGGQVVFLEAQRRLGHRFLDDTQLSLGWRIER
jgi:outer membrane lipase/esterase